MAMSKHTPGQWSSELGNCITADFGDVGIAILEPLDSIWCCDVNRLPEGDELDANARLIAAAPDLLEACIAMQQAMRSISVDVKDLWHELDLAKCAIDKATRGK